jgi:hypothetical protein
MAEYTCQEILALVAPLVDLDLESANDAIIIVGDNDYSVHMNTVIRRNGPPEDEETGERICRLTYILTMLMSAQKQVLDEIHREVHE